MDRKLDKVLLIVSFLADALALLAWAGFPTGNYAVRFSIILTLATVAITLSLFVLYSAVRRWFSPLAAVRPFDRAQILFGGIFLLVGSALIYALTQLPSDEELEKRNLTKTSSAEAAATLLA